MTLHRDTKEKQGCHLINISNAKKDYALKLSEVNKL